MVQTLRELAARSGVGRVLVPDWHQTTINPLALPVSALAPADELLGYRTEISNTGPTNPGWLGGRGRVGIPFSAVPNYSHDRQHCGKI